MRRSQDCFEKIGLAPMGEHAKAQDTITRLSQAEAPDDRQWLRSYATAMAVTFISIW